MNIHHGAFYDDEICSCGKPVEIEGDPSGNYAPDGFRCEAPRPHWAHRDCRSKQYDDICAGHDDSIYSDICRAHDGHPMVAV